MDSNSTDPVSTGLSSTSRGTAPPLVNISATDQTGVVLIGTSLCLIFTLVSLCIRLYIRVQFRHELSLDDITSYGAVVVSAFQSGLVFSQALNGFGMTVEDISEPGLVNLQKYGYAADILYIVALWLTKCSAAFLFIRLSPYKRHILSSKVCLVLSTFLAILSILLVALRCDLRDPWLFIRTQCTGLLWRWGAVTAFEITAETALLAVAVYMAQGLQLPLKKKFVVLCAFSLRTFVVIPAIVRLYFLSTEFASDDQTLDGALACVCGQIQMSYAIVATTTPCLRPFMSALNTHYGGPTETRTPSGSKASKTGRSDNEYSLGTLASPNPTRVDRGRELRDEGNLASVEIGLAVSTRWSHSEDRIEPVFGGRPSDLHSLQSNDSQRRIIPHHPAWQGGGAEEEVPQYLVGDNGRQV